MVGGLGGSAAVSPLDGGFDAGLVATRRDAGVVATTTPHDAGVLAMRDAGATVGAAAIVDAGHTTEASKMPSNDAGTHAATSHQTGTKTTSTTASTTTKKDPTAAAKPNGCDAPKPATRLIGSEWQKWLGACPVPGCAKERAEFLLHTTKNDATNDMRLALKACLDKAGMLPKKDGT
jgi:hypothetical protein